MTARYGFSDLDELLPELPEIEKPTSSRAPIPTGESTIDTWNEAHGADWVAEMLTNTGRWLPVRGQYPNRAGEYHVDFVGSSTPGTSAVVYPDGHLSNFSETAASELGWLGVRQKHDAVDIAVHLHHGGDRSAWIAEARSGGFGKEQSELDWEAWVDEQGLDLDLDEGEYGAGDWYVADVKAILAGKVTRPTPDVYERNDGQGIFYTGRINGVFGPSGEGKSWIALEVAAYRMLRGEAIFWLDWEDEAVGAISRLIDLGVPEDVIGERFIHVKPRSGWNDGARALLARLVVERGVTTAVVDSTGEAMAMDGVKPNEDDETARWFQVFPGWLTDRGVTVLLIDHVPKNADGRADPIGSQRKKAAVTGMSISLEQVKPFAKGQSGQARAICAKDRWGAFAKGETVAMFEIDAREGGTLSISAVKPASQEEIKAAGLRRRAEDVYLFLDGQKDDDGNWIGVPKQAIKDAVKGKQELTVQAVDLLIERGIVSYDWKVKRCTVLRPFDLGVGNDPVNDWLNDSEEPY